MFMYFTQIAYNLMKLEKKEYVSLILLFTYSIMKLFLSSTSFQDGSLKESFLLTTALKES